jgi:N-acetylglucosamine kinase-like BadF-type ATPase
VAQLAPLVLQAAREGDRVARRIVRRGTVELARAAVVAGDHLGFGAAPLPIALGGSLLLRAPDVRAAVLGAIGHSRLLGEIALVEQPAHSAAQAAIALAIAARPSSPAQHREE